MILEFFQEKGRQYEFDYIHRAQQRYIEHLLDTNRKLVNIIEHARRTLLQEPISYE